MIAAERLRQVEEEGWDAAHDDDHGDAVLSAAATCYRAAARGVESPRPWPWSADWWKPSADPIRNFVKAGALYQAEADRARRMGDPFVAEVLEQIVTSVALEIDAAVGS
jgi:hypothetical protein